jgi:signal transduction histidine kinase
MSLGLLGNSIIPQKQDLFNQVGKYINMAIEEIRNISHRLAPAFFDDTTMEEAFRRLFDNFNLEKKYRICMHFNNAATNYPVSLEIQLNLYRILQEQLKNIVKYSNADLIEVDVIIHNNKLVMTIADDGIGFAMCTVKKGIGLANIKRRTELFYGKCEINSSPGKGCEILISIPLPELN